MSEYLSRFSDFLNTGMCWSCFSSTWLYDYIDFVLWLDFCSTTVLFAVFCCYIMSFQFLFPFLRYNYCGWFGLCDMFLWLLSSAECDAMSLFSRIWFLSRIWRCYLHYLFFVSFWRIVAVNHACERTVDILSFLDFFIFFLHVFFDWCWCWCLFGMLLLLVSKWRTEDHLLLMTFVRISAVSSVSNFFQLTN